MTPPIAMSWQGLIEAGNLRLEESDATTSGSASKGDIAAHQDEQNLAPSLPSLKAPWETGDVTINKRDDGHQYSDQIDPHLLAAHPERHDSPQQTQPLPDQATSTSSDDQQHTKRIFGQRLDPRSVHLQNSISAGPAPLIPMHESKAHQTLREIAPKLQALLDLFAAAYETHDMAKVEELRRRLSWAIDARGN